MNKFEFVNEMSKLRTSSTFLTLHGYRNNSGEVADHMIIFHMSYKNALEKSLAIVEAFVAEPGLDEQAKSEVCDSFRTSLTGFNDPIEEIDDAYQRFSDDDGKYIKGIKMHRESGQLHIYGLGYQKRVITPGVYKTKNSRPLTLAKEKLVKLCPVSKFRQYIISTDRVDSIRVQGLEMLPPERI